MPRVGFEPTTPVFERAKTVHALGRAVTVIGKDSLPCSRNSYSEPFQSTLPQRSSLIHISILSPNLRIDAPRSLVSLLIVLEWDTSVTGLYKLRQAHFITRKHS
jgi:hypothetical protein